MYYCGANVYLTFKDIYPISLGCLLISRSHFKRNFYIQTIALETNTVRSIQHILSKSSTPSCCTGADGGGRASGTSGEGDETGAIGVLLEMTGAGKEHEVDSANDKYEIHIIR